MHRRKFGRRSGIRRHQRPGQTALHVGKTLDPKFSVGVPDQEVVDRCCLCNDFCLGLCDDDIDAIAEAPSSWV